VDETKAAVTLPSAREFTEMSASEPIEKETEVSMTSQREANMSRTTREGTTSLSMTLQPSSSTFPSTSTQGQWTFITNELPPTLHQNDNAKHESLVVIAGNNVSLHCTSSVDANFHWKYRSLGSRHSMWIYIGNRLNRAFHRAASLNVSRYCGTRNCTLTVSGFQLGDAGFVACVGGDVDKYWSFTILGKYMQRDIVSTQSFFSIRL